MRPIAASTRPFIEASCGEAQVCFISPLEIIDLNVPLINSDPESVWTRATGSPNSRTSDRMRDVP